MSIRKTGTSPISATCEVLSGETQFWKLWNTIITDVVNPGTLKKLHSRIKLHWTIMAMNLTFFWAIRKLVIQK